MKNFNFNFKHLLVLGIALITCINTAWGTDYTTVFETDFADWSARTLSVGDKGKTDTITLGGIDFIVKNTKNIVINSGDPASGAVVFCENGTLNASSSLRISLRLNTKCKLTITHIDNASSKKLRHDLEPLGTAPTSSDLTLNKSTTTTSKEWNELTPGDYVIYLAAAGTSTQAAIKGIKIETDAASSCTTSPTVTAGDKSSVTATTATVTCSSGISSLGSAGCSISSYGFVLNTTGTPTISDTKHQVGTSVRSLS